MQQTGGFLDSLADVSARPQRHQRPLSLLHDRFSAWIDNALGKVAMCKLREDSQKEAGMKRFVRKKRPETIETRWWFDLFGENGSIFNFQIS